MVPRKVPPSFGNYSTITFQDTHLVGGQIYNFESDNSIIGDPPFLKNIMIHLFFNLFSEYAQFKEHSDYKSVL